MSYLVTARKFRPQTFASIVGQQHVTRALTNAIFRGKVPHALLFCGPRGVGKTSCARVFSKALNCTGRELPELSQQPATDRSLVEPCGECTNCQEIARSTSMAVREIDGASNNSVDNVRELIESLRSLPQPGSRYKVYIIDEVHMLSTAAFNALLKSLEEPPPQTVFIFATTEPHKIPETVISRCQRHDFRALATNAIADQLADICQAQNVAYDVAALELLARKAHGGMRDAQSMFDRVAAAVDTALDLKTVQSVLGLVDSEYWCRLCRAIFDQQPEKCFELVDEAFVQSLDIRSFVADFLSYWRNLLLASFSHDALRVQTLLKISEEEYGELRELLEGHDSFTVQRLFALAENLASQALSTNFPRYVIEAGFAKMATLESLRPLSNVLADLEGVLKEGKLSKAVTIGATAKPSRPVENNRGNVATTGAAERGPERGVEKRPASPASAGVSTTTFAWKEFVDFTQKQSRVVLSSHLRRVRPISFKQGQIVIEGEDFDTCFLGESETLSLMKGLLKDFSGISSWEIQFSTVERKQETSVPAPREAKVTKTPVEGSIAELEKREQDARRKELDREAREHPLVQSALSTFAGSKIEKVSVPE